MKPRLYFAGGLLFVYVGFVVLRQLSTAEAVGVAFLIGGAYSMATALVHASESVREERDRASRRGPS